MKIVMLLLVLLMCGCSFTMSIGRVTDGQEILTSTTHKNIETGKTKETRY